jgi:hypothetical protein
VIEGRTTYTTTDPLEAPMFRTLGGQAWHCGWCSEVCHDDFWVEQHRQFHRGRLENFLSLRAEQR